MLPLKFGFAEFEFHGDELASQNRNEKIPAPAGGLQKARVYALCLALDKIEHLVDQPRRCEDLPVIGDALFRFDQVHVSRTPVSCLLPLLGRATLFCLFAFRVPFFVNRQQASVNSSDFYSQNDLLLQIMR